jgi:hypothetical protein
MLRYEVAGVHEKRGKPEGDRSTAPALRHSMFRKAGPQQRQPLIQLDWLKLQWSRMAVQLPRLGRKKLLS